jgi:hypothetical protein
MAICLVMMVTSGCRPASLAERYSTSTTPSEPSSICLVQSCTMGHISVQQWPYVRHKCTDACMAMINPLHHLHRCERATQPALCNKDDAAQTRLTCSSRMTYLYSIREPIGRST